MATETMPRTETFSEEDTGNLISMEHVNLRMPDQRLATLFYIVGLGFTRDPYMNVGVDNMWVNVGAQQFHLPTFDHGQVLRGHVGLVVPSLDAVAASLANVAPRLEGTKFSWKREGNLIHANCPWGNHFHLYEPAEELGPISVGIPYVEFTVPVGAADGIAAFYVEGFMAPTSVSDDGNGKAATVHVGTYQRLIFREAADVPEYEGDHIAVYVANFSKPYAYLAERDLIMAEPANHQLRFKDIADPATGKVIFTIEHEVRSMAHPGYHRNLVNRQPDSMWR